MESFLESLRKNALYIRLVADKKYGGAVDINHLTKALTSINISYKNYVKARAKEFITGNVTSSTEKEIGKLVAESELLLVDLNFSSFQGAVSPNTEVIEHHFASIRDVLEVKRNSFRGYKKDVFNTNYGSESFQERILNRFTEQERTAIYKPLIDNILTKKHIRLYFGDEPDKTDKQIANVTPDTIKRLIPGNKAIKSHEENKLYVVYASASGEMDLFGEKPKFKYLAVEQLDMPTYPYQLLKIESDGLTIELREKLSAEVTYDRDANQFIISYPDFNIMVWGSSREEAEDAFNFTFASLVNSIYLEEDVNLTAQAIALKKNLHKIIKSVS